MRGRGVRASTAASTRERRSTMAREGRPNPTSGRVRASAGEVRGAVAGRCLVDSKGEAREARP